MIISELSPQIVHDTASPLCRLPIGSAKTGQTVTLAFTDISGAVEDAELILWGDDFERSYEMALRDGRWFASINTPATPAALWYCFRLSLPGGEYWLCAGERGRFAQLMSSRGEGFRLTVYDAEFKTPDWLHRGVMYQIFPDRFARDETDTARLGVEQHRTQGRTVVYHESWNEPVEWQPNTAEGFYFPLDFYGGTLRGIENRLGYLKHLGVTAIYLNPIFEACSNHRYDTADYLRVDPILGTNEDFQSLTARAKEHGIRIMLDGVFSHIGADSIYFNKFSNYPGKGAYNAGESSPYYDWFDFREFPDKYRCWWDFPDLPEVKEDNPRWQSFVVSGDDSVVKTWLKLGASGWRLDVADELPDDVLALIRKASKQAHPDAAVLGEVWEDPVVKSSYGKRRKYALGESLDSVMNYPLRTALINFFTLRTDSRALADFLLDQRLNYPAPMYWALMNLVSSHDSDRIRTALATRLDARSMTREQQSSFIVSDAQDARGAIMHRLCAALQFALPGIPSVYYGDETGMNGMLDPFDRAPFNLGARPLIDWYVALGAARGSCDALNVGAIAVSAPDPDVICILRLVTGGTDQFGTAADDGAILAVVNRSSAEKHVVVDLWLDNAGLAPHELEELKARRNSGGCCLLTGMKTSISSGLAELKLPPQSAFYFQLTEDTK